MKILFNNNMSNIHVNFVLLILYSELYDTVSFQLNVEFCEAAWTIINGWDSYGKFLDQYHIGNYNDNFFPGGGSSHLIDTTTRLFNFYHCHECTYW